MNSWTNSFVPRWNHFGQCKKLYSILYVVCDNNNSFWKIACSVSPLSPYILLLHNKPYYTKWLILFSYIYNKGSTWSAMNTTSVVLSIAIIKLKKLKGFGHLYTQQDLLVEQIKIAPHLLYNIDMEKKSKLNF